MRVPEKLASAFGADFEFRLSKFLVESGRIPEPSALGSQRFLSRSVVPHVKKLSALFNRMEGTADEGLDPYWKDSQNPENLRLAYFLYFMPCNLFRMASVWAELARLGFQWQASEFRGIEFGAGPASGACGIAAGEQFAPTGLPKSGSFALIEQDKGMLELGASWASRFFADSGFADWSVRPFHRKLKLSQGFLPRSAPGFHLWLMSYFLNEFSESPAEIARALIDAWDRHLEEEGLAVMVEPALKLQSRRLLEVRRALLEEARKRRIDWLQVLTPCLGHQACGALAAKEDWCHEEAIWWRPPYFRTIDSMAGLDRKSLPFSYLVVIRSKRDREEILPATAGSSRLRLVSPAHFEGRDQEFFVCGEDGKKRARYRAPEGPLKERELSRGDILLGSEVRGDIHASRIEKIEGIAGEDPSRIPD